MMPVCYTAVMMYMYMMDYYDACYRTQFLYDICFAKNSHAYFHVCIYFRTNALKSMYVLTNKSTLIMSDED